MSLKPGPLVRGSPLFWCFGDADAVRADIGTCAQTLKGPGRSRGRWTGVTRPGGVWTSYRTNGFHRSTLAAYWQVVTSIDQVVGHIDSCNLCFLYGGLLDAELRTSR